MQTAEQKDEKPEIVAALKGVFEYLLESFQRANAPPELGVIDAIVAGLNELDEDVRRADGGTRRRRARRSGGHDGG